MIPIMKRNMPSVIVALIVSCVLLSAAYTAYAEYEAVSGLEYELYDASVSRLGLTSADVELNLRFYNPASLDTPAFRAEFDVYIANGYIGHGCIDGTKVLAGSSSLQSITLTVSYANATKAIIDALRDKSFNLTARGIMNTGVLFGTIPLSFPFQAQIQLLKEIAYGHITVGQAKELIESDHSLVIVDVRTVSEFRGGHIEGAVNIPVDDLQQSLGELDPNDEILVYCRTGVRSARAMQILSDNGFPKIYNMLGGIEAWKGAGYPVTSE